MPSTFTPNKVFEKPARGELIGVWDAPWNNNVSIIDNSLGGVVTLGLTNSPVTLSSGQYQCVFLRFTGAITANIPITLPPVGSFYTIINETTNSSAFYLTAQTTAAGGAVVGIPPGAMTDIMTDGTHTRFRGLPPVGSYWDYAGSSTPGWVSACTIPPWLYCNGTTFSSATYPALTAFMGGTTLPDFRGRGAVAINDGTSRFLSSTSGVDGNTLFAAGGNQSVTISSLHLPNISFPVTDPGHVHTITHNAITGTTGPIDSSFQLRNSNTLAATITISSAITGITVGTGGSGSPIPLVTPTVIIGIRHIRAA